MLKTRSQRFAAAAHARIGELALPPDTPPEQAKSLRTRQKKYGAMAHKLPVLIRTSGLAQALAFVEASAEKEKMHRKLLDHLSQTVAPGKDLADLCRQSSTSLPEYMRLTRDALEALLWYKRFAQSVLGVQSAADEPAADESSAEGGAGGGA